MPPPISHRSSVGHGGVAIPDIRMDNGNGSSGLRTYRAEMNNADGLDRTCEANSTRDANYAPKTVKHMEDLGNPNRNSAVI